MYSGIDDRSTLCFCSCLALLPHCDVLELCRGFALGKRVGAAVIAFQRDLSFARSLNGLRRTVEEGHAWGCVGKRVVLFSMILCSVLGAQWCLGLPTLLHAEICARFPALVKQQEYSDSVCSVLRTWPIYFSWLEKSVFDNGTVLACVRMFAFVICDI